MWLIEGALEVHLGEFHVRMKGNRAEGMGSSPFEWVSGFLRALGLLPRGGVGQNSGVLTQPWACTPVTCDLRQVPPLL